MHSIRSINLRTYLAGPDFAESVWRFRLSNEIKVKCYRRRRHLWRQSFMSVSQQLYLFLGTRGEFLYRTVGCLETSWERINSFKVLTSNCSKLTERSNSWSHFPKISQFWTNWWGHFPQKYKKWECSYWPSGFQPTVKTKTNEEESPESATMSESPIVY